MKNTYLQIAQMISGIMAGLLLIVHIGVQRLDVILRFLGIPINDPLSFNSMIERSKQISWVTLYSLLLFFALLHASNGLYKILIEMNLSRTSLRILVVLIILIGLMFFVLGIYAPIKLFVS